MRSLYVRMCLLLGWFLVAGIVFSGESGADIRDDLVVRDAGLGTDPFLDPGCTVIYAADENQALGGNNEDYSDPDTMVWFLPAEDEHFGRVLFGYENFIWQGGLNDQGLFFDALATDERISVSKGDKTRYPGSLPWKALAECADVKCVKKMFEEYHAYDEWTFQFMFGDAYGNSVIIEPLTMIDGGAPFQVATNFYQSRTNITDCRYCDRYWTARNLFEKSPDLSVELMRDILNAVHLEGDYPTQYSTIYDLKGGLVYLYHFHNYSSVVIFNLAEELAKGYHASRLAELFPENPAFLEWAQPYRDKLAEKRAAYTVVEVDPLVYGPLLGDYAGPTNLSTLYPYYSVDYLNGNLILKLLPDKAWMKLEPTSPTTFFHISETSRFEITFLPEENGEVNQFTYTYLGKDYQFTRVEQTATEANLAELESDAGELPAWLGYLYRIGHFLGTNTFKFLAIILGLILLQTLLDRVRSSII